MYDKEINGVLYKKIVYEEDEYIVQFTDKPRHSGKYTNRFRVVNTMGGENNHTHLDNMGVCKKLIKFVKQKKIPLTAKKYFIKSCYRLSLDEIYIEKLKDFYYRKRKKLSYKNNPYLFSK